MPEWSVIDNSFDKCLKCNACTVNCPISGVSLDFGGPKHLGPEFKRLTDNQITVNEPSIELCTLCGTCDRSCPEGVRVSLLTAYGKAVHAENSGINLRDLTLSRAELVGKLASAFAPVTNKVMKIKPARKLMEWTMHIPADRQFPEYKYNHFKKKYKKKEATTERKVAFFSGCYTTYNAPHVGEAFIKVMEYNGIEVALPDQKCCGVPMFANGQMKQGLKNASSNTDSLLSYANEGYDIVTTCSSCASSLKKDYPAFLKTEEAVKVSKNIYGSEEYLRKLYEEGELNMSLASLNEKAGYFSPCHMKGQGVGSPAMDILELIPDYKVEDMDAGCCGQCGTFGFKKEKYPLSMRIGNEVRQTIAESTKDYIVTECGMCKNQLNQLAVDKVKHPIEIIKKSYESVLEKDR
jgi:glycerol-3-phosphate dehydrogenase subunit C